MIQTMKKYMTKLVKFSPTFMFQLGNFHRLSFSLFNETVATQHTSRRVGECVVCCGRKPKDSRASPESYALSRVWWERGQSPSRSPQSRRSLRWVSAVFALKAICQNETEGKGQAEGPSFRFLDLFPGSWVPSDHKLSWFCLFFPLIMCNCAHTLILILSLTLIRRHCHSAQRNSTQMFL